MNKIIFLMVAACGLLHSAVIADIDCTDSINFTTSFCGFSSQSGEYLVVGERASLSGTSALIISGDDPTDYLGTIYVELNTSIAPLSVRLFVRDGVSDRTSIGTIEQIRKDAGFPFGIDIVAITGDLGAASQPSLVDANTIRQISLGGDCYADIRAIDGNPLFDAGILIDGSWKKGSAAFKGQSIDFIDVDGDIGSTTESVAIWSSDTIKSIEVGGDFFGTIGENSLGFTDDTTLESLEVVGDFNGTAPMIIQALDDVAIGGNFDAEITVLDPLDSIATYDIGGEFSNTSTLSFPASGLEGQIVINSSNSSDDWLGDVEVGSVTLAKNYTNLSDELGGGTAGVAPFNFHQRTTAPPSGTDRDCDPFHTETQFLTTSDTLTEATISHYGPVYADGADGINDAGEHFRIEFRPDYFSPSGPFWFDRSASFEVDISQSGTDDASATRRIVIKPASGNTAGFKAAGQWRIRPLAGKVKCAGVTGNPDVEYDSSVVSGDLGSTSGPQYDWYAFRVRLLAPVGGSTLLSGDNGPTVEDLNWWMVEPYETNADGTTDFEDFSDMADRVSEE